MEKLVIAGREFNSRLFLGTGKFNNNQLMAEAIKASETEMVTVAMKRIELEDKQDDLLAHIVQNPNIQLLPNPHGRGHQLRQDLRQGQFRVHGPPHQHGSRRSHRPPAQAARHRRPSGHRLHRDA